MTAAIRVALVDDQPLVRMGLATLIAAEPDLELAGEAADGREGLALLRRTTVSEDDAEVLEYADLKMDLASREVYRDGSLIELTRTEFNLLELFLRRPRRVLERSFILEEVWGFDFPTTANSLEVYVGYLRRKTENDGGSRLIHTVRGVGYVLRETPAP